MGMSNDFTNLEVVKDFSAFVEAMKDPTALSNKLKEVQAATEEHKRVLGVVQTKEQADAYLTNAKATVAKWAKEDEEKEKQFKARVDKTNKDLKEQQDRITQTLVDATRKAMEAETKLTKALANFNETGAALQKAKDQQQVVDEKVKELQVKEKELDARLATVKKMLGE